MAVSYLTNHVGSTNSVLVANSAFYFCCRSADLILSRCIIIYFYTKSQSLIRHPHLLSTFFFYFPMICFHGFYIFSIQHRLELSFKTSYIRFTPKSVYILRSLVFIFCSTALSPMIITLILVPYHSIMRWKYVNLIAFVAMVISLQIVFAVIFTKKLKKYIGQNEIRNNRAILNLRH